MNFDDFQDFEMEDLSRVPAVLPPVIGGNNVINDGDMFNDLHMGELGEELPSNADYDSILDTVDPQQNILSTYQPPNEQKKYVNHFNDNKKTVIFTTVYMCSIILLLFIVFSLSVAALAIAVDLQSDINNLQFEVIAPINAPPPVYYYKI